MGLCDGPLLKTPEEIRPVSMAYLRLLFAGLPVVTAYNLAASMLRALGDGRTPLIAMAAASLTNIALDFWFVKDLHWGVRGAAAATIIAQCLAAGCCILRLRRVEVLRLKREDLLQFVESTGHSPIYIDLPDPRQEEV